MEIVGRMEVANGALAWVTQIFVKRQLIIHILHA
jgi:hypothetical protein